MDKALSRLRLGFVLLGALLLSPLLFVLRAAEDRLEEQRKLRHAIVAERIFDEMERELNTLLANEASRSSDAYAATDTQVSSWSPFVVGYFTSGRSGTQVVARTQLAQARSLRVSQAVDALWQSSERPQFAHERDQNKAGELERTAAPPASPTQDQVLRQLNRARKAKSGNAPAKSSGIIDDPLMGL